VRPRAVAGRAAGCGRSDRRAHVHRRALRVVDRRGGEAGAQAAMTSARRLVLLDLATRIGGVSLGRPLRIAVDGRTAAGKTTLSDELAEVIREGGKPGIRT